MRYDRLFTKLYCRPVLIQQAAFYGLETALLNHVGAHSATGGQKMPRPDVLIVGGAPEMGKMGPNNRQARMNTIVERVTNDTLLIHVDGVIDKHLSNFEMECYGGFDLRDFDNAIDAARADDQLRNVLLVFNSPGGSVTGVPESAQKVADLAKVKNVFAFTDGMCCSAAYYIASQADQIFGTASSDVGSIGVYCALLDCSRFYEKQGVKVNFIKDGAFKGMGAPFKPLTDDERAMFQAEVEKIGSMFRAAVSSKRPQVTTETMQGQSFFGDSALDAKLVDAIVPDIGGALRQF